MSLHPSPQAIRPRTWWLAALLTVVLAVISAGGLVLLAWGWYLVLPVWSILILVIAGTFFAVSRVRPWHSPMVSRYSARCPWLSCSSSHFLPSRHRAENPIASRLSVISLQRHAVQAGGAGPVEDRREGVPIHLDTPTLKPMTLSKPQPVPAPLARTSTSAINLRSAQPPGQRDRVSRGVHLRVIIEINEYLAWMHRRGRGNRVIGARTLTSLPATDPLGPDVQRLVGVAADVEL
jgi:hypothetical protein